MKEVKIYDSLVGNLNEELKDVLIKIPLSLKGKVEEIRLKRERPLMIYFEGKDYFVSKTGNVTRDISQALIVEEKYIESTFQLISNYSPYAYLEEIKNGYITITGGHRIGIGGKVVYGINGIENIKNISSLNIRIAREKIGISDFLIPYLIKGRKDFYNTLIISPPQCGKTTLLRDIVRNLSNGMIHSNCEGFKVSLIDERSELAGMYNGVPQKDVGLRTDILDGCLKSDGIIMAIRSLSPDIIAVDEIGGKRDVEAIHEALRAGIKLIATIHGSSIHEVREKQSMREIFEEKIFGRYIVLDRSKGVGTIKELIDGSGNPIHFIKGAKNAIS
ncbi:MAG: stage III sporulation protein AA [Tissierellia bacterium]|nr:stage III sporulation protein AA [Tissierellia bacterium]